MADHMRPLQAWLERIGARLVWQSKIPNWIGLISAYHVNGKVFLVQTFSNNNGWEVFIPASDKNNTSLTLDNAALFLGVEGCRGLVD
jgi:hypothetical protein